MTVYVTGVGSLPHTAPAAAAAFVAETTTVPYLPQLPNRHPAEGMLAQWGDGIAGCGAVPDGIGLSYGAGTGFSDEAFVGAAAALDTVAGPVVKTQATGPVTLAMAALAAGHPGAGLWDQVVTGLVGRISSHLEWIQSRRPDTEVMLVVDEPALAGLTSSRFPIGAAAAEEALGRVLDALGVPAGVHCCGDTDWALVAGLDPAWISWDVLSLGDGLLRAVDAVAAAVAAGTVIMWGIVPVSSPPLPSVADLIGHYRNVAGMLTVAGAPAEDPTRDLWMTPACGLAGLTPSQAANVAETLGDVGRAVYASV